MSTMEDQQVDKARRLFLSKACRFAVTAPPAMVTILATASIDTPALAQSGTSQNRHLSTGKCDDFFLKCLIDRIF